LAWERHWQTDLLGTGVTLTDRQTDLLGTGVTLGAGRIQIPKLFFRGGRTGPMRNAMFDNQRIQESPLTDVEETSPYQDARVRRMRHVRAWTDADGHPGEVALPGRQVETDRRTTAQGGC
jgi:hypothetical protein